MIGHLSQLVQIQIKRKGLTALPPTLFERGLYYMEKQIEELKRQIAEKNYALEKVIEKLDGESDWQELQELCEHAIIA